MKSYRFNGRIEGPRFVVKFVNGLWTIFDRLTFTNCEPNLRLKKTAQELLDAPPKHTN